jgi:hypothetical protein
VARETTEMICAALVGCQKDDDERREAAKCTMCKEEFCENHGQLKKYECCGMFLYSLA